MQEAAKKVHGHQMKVEPAKFAAVNKKLALVKTWASNLWKTHSFICFRFIFKLHFYRFIYFSSFLILKRLESLNLFFPTEPKIRFL